MVGRSAGYWLVGSNVPRLISAECGTAANSGVAHGMVVCGG